MVTWTAAPPPPATRIGPRGWLRVLGRGLALGGITFGGLGVMLMLRLLERPLFGLRRPWTPHITCLVCRSAFRILGIRYRVQGEPMEAQGAVVANHASWLDIFALNAPQRIYFVSKAEVAGWPGIGWLARATGTLFIRRRRAEAAAQARIIRERLSAGHRLLFFPEGTSTDGLRVLPFRSTLFAAFFEPGLRERTHVQPVTLVYHAPVGEDPRFYGWWGDMDFGPHLLKVLAAPRQGEVEVIFHEPLRVSAFADRKALARAAEAAVRSAMPAERRGPGHEQSPPPAGQEVPRAR